EAREADELDAALAEHLDDALVERLAALERLVVDHFRRDPVLGRALERDCARSIADDHANLGRHAAAFDRIDDRLQVGTASRSENPQRQRVRHRYSTPSPPRTISPIM